MIAEIKYPQNLWMPEYSRLNMNDDFAVIIFVRILIPFSSAAFVPPSEVSRVVLKFLGARFIIACSLTSPPLKTGDKPYPLEIKRM